jgi:hypothetical protein
MLARPQNYRTFNLPHLGPLARKLTWNLLHWRYAIIEARLDAKYGSYKREDPEQDAFLRGKLAQLEDLLGKMEHAARTPDQFAWIEYKTKCSGRKHRCWLSGKSLADEQSFADQLSLTSMAPTQEDQEQAFMTALALACSHKELYRLSKYIASHTQSQRWGVRALYDDEILRDEERVYDVLKTLSKREWPKPPPAT